MGIVEGITGFFEAHSSVRKIVKQLIIGSVALVATVGLANVNMLDGTNYAYAIPILMAVFNGLNEWTTKQPTLPIVGARLSNVKK